MQIGPPPVPPHQIHLSVAWQVRKTLTTGVAGPKVHHLPNTILPRSSTTMSIDDLAILADALAFALIVTIGGLTSWALSRELSRRPGLRREVRVALSCAALLAVALAGGAMRPTAGDGVDVVAKAVVGPGGLRATNPSSEPREVPEPIPASPSDDGMPRRLEGSLGTEGAVEHSTLGGGGGSGGPGEDPSTGPGPGTDTSPSPSPSPTPVDPPDGPPANPPGQPPGLDGGGPPGQDGWVS